MSGSFIHEVLLFRQYKELLFRKDELMADAGKYEIRFLKKFGTMMVALFRVKIRCLKLKKTIAYCRASLNQTGRVNFDAVESLVNEDMKFYYEDLDELVKGRDEARDNKDSFISGSKKAKRIYRRIAGKIHPDINDKTSSDDELRELWNRAFNAYSMNDIEELSDLERKIRRTLADKGMLNYRPHINKLERRIEVLRDEIDEIITTEPYTYRPVLESLGKSGRKRIELLKEYEEYNRYYDELYEVLHDLMTGGDSLSWSQE